MKRALRKISLVLASLMIIGTFSSCLLKGEAGELYSPINDPANEDCYPSLDEQNHGEEANRESDLTEDYRKDYEPSDNYEPAFFGMLQNPKEWLWGVDRAYMEEGDAYVRFLIYDEEGKTKVYTSTTMQYFCDDTWLHSYNDSRVFSSEELDEILASFDERNMSPAGAQIALELSHDESFVDSWVSDLHRAVMVEIRLQELFYEALNRPNYDAHFKGTKIEWNDDFSSAEVFWELEQDVADPFVCYKVIVFHMKYGEMVPIYESKITDDNHIVIDDIDVNSLSTDGCYMYRVAARKADTPEGIWYITAGIGRFYSAWDDRSWYTF